MSILTAQQILEADDLETRDEEVPEWGGTVRLRELTGTERDEYEASLRIQRGKKFLVDTSNIRAKLVGRAIIDENGERVFTPQQINALGKKSASVLDRLFDVVAEMSGLNDAADEDAEGKSEQGEGSTSDSPATSD